MDPGVAEWIGTRLRRSAITVVNVAFNHDLFLAAFGFFNRRIGFLRFLFLVYPATETYAAYYAPPRRKVSWQPVIAGVYRQAEGWGLIFAVPVSEAELRDRNNCTSVIELMKRMDHIRALTGAEYSLYAGVLPGLLYRLRARKQFTEADTTTRLLVTALEAVRGTVHYDSTVPIVIVGGAGYLGRHLRRHLSNRPVFSVDPDNSASQIGRWETLRDQPVILLNVATAQALAELRPTLWSSVVIINDAYPEPPPATVAALCDMGIRVFHVCGAEGTAFPAFPGAYADAIPCCGAAPGVDHKIVVIELGDELRRSPPASHPTSPDDGPCYVRSGHGADQQSAE